MLPLVVGFCVILIAVDNYYKKKLTSVKIESQINKLAIGDSHMEKAFNDALIPNSINLGRASESLFYNYNKLRLIESSNPNIDTVFLGIGPQSFSDFYDAFTYSPRMLAVHFFSLSWSAKSELISNIEKPVNVVSNIMIDIIKATGSNNRANVNMWLGKFSNTYSNVQAERDVINRRVRLHFRKKKEERGFSNLNIDYFKSIVRFCKVNDIELILLETPLHPHYESNIPKKFKVLFHDLVSETKLRVIDFSELKFVKSDFLPDGDHLSSEGATKASIYLNQVITK